MTTKHQPNCNQTSTKYEQHVNPISIKQQPNINQTSTKYQPNINQISCENVGNSTPVPVGSRGRPGSGCGGDAAGRRAGGRPLAARPRSTARRRRWSRAASGLCLETAWRWKKNWIFQYELPIECMPVEKNLPYRRWGRCLGINRAISIRTPSPVGAMPTETEE